MDYLEGKTLSGQIALGRLLFYRRKAYELKRESSLSPMEEDERFLLAQRKGVMELAGLHDRAIHELTSSAAAVFAIHAMLLEDEDLTRQVRDMIREEGVTAEYAVHAVGERVAAIFAAMDSPYMQARAVDILDIMRRLEGGLLDIRPQLSLGEEPTILVSDCIYPSEIMEMPRRRILGVVTTGGSVDSHTAQLLRDWHIPALVGVPMDDRWEGRVALMDGNTGRLYLDPDTRLTEQLRLTYEAGGKPAGAEV